MRIVLLASGAQEPGPCPLAPDPGVPVFAAPDGQSVALSSRWFPDQGIKVSKAFAEPEIGPGWLSSLLFRLGKAPANETHEELKRRVVELAIALVDGAKKNGESVFVGGPLMVRLLGYKLSSIGYKGPFLSKVRSLKPREFHY